MMNETAKAIQSGYQIVSGESRPTIIPNALRIQRDPAVTLFPDDHTAAKKAELDGIPIIHDIPGCEDWIYLDTQENRRIVKKALSYYPRFDYRTWNRKTPDWTIGNLFASDLEVSGDGESVEATFECYFDWGEKFGVNFQKIEEDVGDPVWLNLYANYFPKTGEMTMHFTVDDTCNNDTFDYVPSDSDRAVAVAAMEIASKQEWGCSLAALVAHEQSPAPASGCEVFFAIPGKEDTTRFSVLLALHRDGKNTLSNIMLTEEEQRIAQAIARNVVGAEAISSYAITEISVLCGADYLLAEARDRELYQVDFFDSFEAAHAAMCSRVADARHVSPEEILSAYQHNADFDEDTILEELQAQTEFDGNLFDWAIIAISPVPGAKVEDADSRYLVISLFNRDISASSPYETEALAQAEMLNQAQMILSASGHSQPEVVISNDSIRVKTDVQHEWSVIPLA